jgi:hypothetical protein
MAKLNVLFAGILFVACSAMVAGGKLISQQDHAVIANAKKVSIAVPEKTVPGKLWTSTKKPFTLEATKLYVISRCTDGSGRVVLVVVLIPEKVTEGLGKDQITSRVPTKDDLRQVVAQLSAVNDTPTSGDALQAVAQVPGAYMCQVSSHQPSFSLPEEWDRALGDLQWEFFKRPKLEKQARLLKVLFAVEERKAVLKNLVQTVVPGQDSIVSRDNYLELSEWMEYYVKHGTAPGLTVIDPTISVAEILSAVQAHKVIQKQPK